jgi:type II secretory pathway component PulF
VKLAYTAYDQTGRTVNGTIESTDTLSATEVLRGQGLFVAEIDENLHATLPQTSSRRRGRGPNLKSVAVFTRQLQVLLSSGTPLVDALSALKRQAKPGPWETTLSGLRQGVEGGRSLTEAMEVYPGAFDDVYRSLVAAGESSGQLPEMLERLAVYKQKQLRVRNTVVGALIYPSMLISLALTMFCMLLLFVIPRFDDLFKTLSVPLPATTRILVNLSEAFRRFWWLFGLVVAGELMGLVWFLRGERARPWRDRLILKVPYLGTIIKGFATARIVRLLSVLLAGHVPLLKALQLIRHCAGNLQYVHLVEGAEEKVAQGESLYVAFDNAALINPSVQEAIRSGESSGRIDQLLGNMAEFLEDDNETIVRSLTTLIEPLILIFMGILVGLIAVSMFLPLFDLTAMTSGGR